MQSDRLLLEKQMPHNSDAERMALGCIILTPDLYAEAAAKITKDDFWLKSHAAIFAAIGRLIEANREPDPLTLISELEASGELDLTGGPAYIAELFDGVPRFSNIDNYIRLISEASLRRQMIRTADAVMSLAFDAEEPALDQLNQAQKMICDLESTEGRIEWHESGDVAIEVLARAEEYAASGRQYLGLATGYFDLDAMTGGLRRGDLIIVGGRPSMGKSGLVGGIATGAATSEANRIGDEQPVIGIFSVEMPRQGFIQRMQCAEARVDLHRMSTGRLNSDDWKRLSEATNKIDQMRLAVDDTARMSPMRMRAALRRLERQRKRLDLVIVDYLQLMQSDGQYDSRVREVTEISRGLKQIAKEFDVPVIAVASLNRSCESRHDKRPILSDLRDSGDIESDADLVMFVYRDEVYNPETSAQNIAEVLVRKHRNGPIGSTELIFLKQCCRFENKWAGGAQ